MARAGAACGEPRRSLAGRQSVRHTTRAATHVPRSPLRRYFECSANACVYMALMLLQVLVLGVFAAAADDVPLTWYWSSRTLVPCTLPTPAPQLRKPPPLRGEDPPTPYSWRRDGVNDTHKILTNGTLDIRKREGADGVYQCTAALRRGALLGYPVRLKTAHLDKFSKYPENTTARRGQPVALPCVISSAPSATISWLKDDQDLSADDRYYLLKDQLLITEVRDSDAGLYRCIATNSYVNKTRTSHGGRLHVAPPEPQALEFMPTFEDRQLLVPEGGDAVLPCPVSGWPRPSEVIWEMAGKRLYNGPVLVLTNVDVSQDGVYTCNVPGHQDLKKTYNVTVTKPVNITLPPVSKEAIRASTIRFNCTATGRPEPNITWYKDGVPLALTEKVRYLSKEAIRASTIRFNCTATGRPEPNITWYKDGVPLALTEKIGLWKAAFLNPGDEERIELVINSITSKDAGVYQCFASNNVSIASAWATLTVTGPPAIAAPQDIACAPLGAQEVLVRWAPVPTDVLAYTVHTTAQGMYIYQCFASNNVSIASAWATLTVTGPPAIAAPQDIACAPLGAQEVLVRWAPVPTDVLAYTVHTTAQEPGGTGMPLGPPVQDPRAVVSVPKALTPYRFQVRAYIQSAKGAATDFSDFVVCQGQGVPINLTKDDKSVLVSWQKFAKQNPGVVEWILQSRMADEHDAVTNVTLDAAVTNYTLDIPEDGDLQIRVLGTRTRPWLQQNLGSVPWRSLDLSTGDVRATPRNIQVTKVTTRGFTVQWETDDLAPRKYKFLVCVLKIDDPSSDDGNCQYSDKHSVTIDNLQPGSDYEVRVETQLQDLEAVEAQLPYRVATLAEEDAKLIYKYINTTTVRVSWNGVGRYTVRHRQKLGPLGDWSTINTDRNTVLLTGLDPNSETYVEVISNEGKAGSDTLTIPPQIKDLDAKDLSYVYTSSGITVSWVGSGPRVVKFAQNITQPLEKWHVVNVTENHVQLAGLDLSLPTYVTVTAQGTGQVLTIPPAPEQPSIAVAFLAGVGIGCAACVLLLLAAAALLVWRRTKMAASPVRSRRRTMSPVEGHEGESSEMKNIGGRLANGGAAGEPLLNGHVHITENPTSKTPNGKTKKGRYEPFDVSRHDADTTLETVLEADSSASYLLDTSRRADFDTSRSSRDLSTNNSFNKLPDDNMNSEITRSSEFTLDNSKIQPTLQPNG
ncbi:neogenin-like [Cydia amplana]|uniref:neogenin-like n=1 Tax=Cydia amplana TaxID=1869771 RepID=UPI002FE554F2